MAMTISDSRECNKCRELLDIEEFGTYWQKGKLRTRHICKACVRVYNKEYIKTVMSLPGLAEKEKQRRRDAAKKYYWEHCNDPGFREKEKAKQKRLRDKMNGQYFLDVSPLVPVLKEFINLYGQDSAMEITGYNKDFLAGLISGKYDLVRADVADTILTRLHGPSFSFAYDGVKKHFVGTHHGKFLGRNLNACR